MLWDGMDNFITKQEKKKQIKLSYSSIFYYDAQHRLHFLLIQIDATNSYKIPCCIDRYSLSHINIISTL